jgi:hypothetical protein
MGGLRFVYFFVLSFVETQSIKNTNHLARFLHISFFEADKVQKISTVQLLIPEFTGFLRKNLLIYD